MIRVLLALALVACGDKKLPSCAEVGCPTTVLCSGRNGPCSCTKPGVAPIACEVGK